MCFSARFYSGILWYKIWKRFLAVFPLRNPLSTGKTPAEREVFSSFMAIKSICMMRARGVI